MPTQLKRARRLHVLIAFASIYSVWGSTYLAIRYAVETIPPFLMLGARYVVSGILLYAWSRMRGTASPSARQWRNAGIAGFFLLVCGNGAVGWAEQTMASGLAALLVSVLPFWLVVIDWVRPRGRSPKLLVIAGLILGVGGIFVLVDPTGSAGSNGISKVSAGVLMLASLCWAIGSFYSRDADLPSSGFMRTAVEMVAGGVLLFALGTFTGELRGFDVHHVSRISALALAYLTTFGSLLGFTAYIWLFDHVSPALAGTYAFVNPVVAVILGWAIAGEALTVRTVIAAAIVIAAVALITLSGVTGGREPEAA